MQASSSALASASVEKKVIPDKAFHVRFSSMNGSQMIGSPKLSRSFGIRTLEHGCGTASSPASSQKLLN
jgi:hypothetical protein